MTIRHTVYLFATTIAPIVLITVIICLFFAETTSNKQLYSLAFSAMIVAVLLMELRVRLGYRTLRGKLFYLHLTAAIPFLISLGILAFYKQPLWLILFCDTLFGILAIAGLQLFYRSIHTTYRKH